MQAVGEYVCCRSVKVNQQTYGDIIIPDMAKQGVYQAEVLSVGSKVPSNIAPGDKVLLPTIGVDAIKHSDKDYKFVKHHDILGHWEPE